MMLTVLWAAGRMFGSMCDLSVIVVDGLGNRFVYMAYRVIALLACRE